ncbi:hypothetical protein [Bacteroides stercorirosoris]|uniref:hypothetical protein n=1 Tax=Bacteroides stercorirosoris TaxID=871324 RepID=UPI000470EE2D|nr:hypothetical protein [Bacteroides stercorirosoris]
MLYIYTVFRFKFLAFATPMAQHCHAYGKTLPHLWHDCAKAMARLCHFDGKKLAMYSFLFPVLNE